MFLEFFFPLNIGLHFSPAKRNKKIFAQFEINANILSRKVRMGRVRSSRNTTELFTIFKPRNPSIDKILFLMDPLISEGWGF